MKSLRIRLTLWFTLGFVAVTVIHITFTYRRLDLELRKDSFERENKINPNWILHGSYTEEEVENIMGEMLRSSLLVSVPLVVLISALGYYIARQSLRPIENLNRQLQAINPGTLGRIVDLPEGDEQFRSLSRHLNDMLARLERSFLEMSEYAAKVAHELRTPITILRHKVEQAQGKIDPDMAEDLQEELLRLNHVVEQSLLIAKAGQGRLVWRNDNVDLSELVGELVKDFELLAHAQDRQIQFSCEPGCVVGTDGKYCKQILHALFNNALIHGRGTIHVRLLRRGKHVDFMTMNVVRSSPTASELTLGLGLRVVRALVGRQPSMKFRQHHGRRIHASCLLFPSTHQRSERNAKDKPMNSIGAGI
ncbi:MAG: HAMP domain-containing protein [Verrucomicrobia bacterium]|nr:HAMP domain-containing protein [Verrucomicrobiota bacterium]